jgi:actin related protein 2/3 complex subunit 1A/1B
MYIYIVTNMLVTCSHDRNAYAWKLNEETNKWEHNLVILKVNRAATFVKWSPAGDKFAVASGSKMVPVCHFQEEENWWVSSAIKKHKSTVTTLAWCPNNKFLITGSTDSKCRIFSAFVAGLDDPDHDDGFGAIFNNTNKFGEVLAEFTSPHKGWVNAVSWAPGGLRVAFCTHSSTVNVVQLVEGGDHKMNTIMGSDLPFMSAEFLGNNALVCGGYSSNPTLFSNNGDDSTADFVQLAKLDKKTEVKKEAKQSNARAAFSMFQNMSSKGEAKSGGDTKASKTLTKHKSYIPSLCVLPGGKVITSCGLDGNIFFWDLVKCGVDMSKLQLPA